MLKLKRIEKAYLLNIDNALTQDEINKILQAADELVTTDSISKDNKRFKNDKKPALKYKRPIRDRAIIYTLIETGMRRNELININIENINFRSKKIIFKEKKKHAYIISKEGLNSINKYINLERNKDNLKWNSNFLFLSSRTINRGNGKLTACVINSIWNKVCKIAGVVGKTPHSSRHAMGKFIMNETGNPAFVQKQLGHVNPIFSIQYSNVSDKDIKDIFQRR